MDCTRPGFPVLHSLLEFAQIYVHWVDDAILSPHFSSRATDDQKDGITYPKTKAGEGLAEQDTHTPMSECRIQFNVHGVPTPCWTLFLIGSLSPSNGPKLEGSARELGQREQVSWRKNAVASEVRGVPGRSNGFRSLDPEIAKWLQSTLSQMECSCRVCLRLALTTS